MIKVLLDGVFFTKIKTPERLNEIASMTELDASRFELDIDDLANYEADKFDEKRAAEYEKQGATIQALTVAMFENDQADIDRLSAIRTQVKIAIPKP